LYLLIGREPSVPSNAVLTLTVGGELAEVAPTDVVAYVRGARTPTVRNIVDDLRKAKVDGRISVSSYEIDHKLGGETYHLVKLLMDDSQLMDRCDFSIIIGLDNAKTFDKWVNYEFLERQIRFITVARPGIEEDPKVQWYRKMPHIYLMPETDEDLIKISSTEVRRMVKENDPNVTKYLHADVLKFVREHKLSTLEDAHWRLSALPAFCAGFRDRGTLREGAAADIIIYDYDNLTYTFPEFVQDLPGNEYRVTNQGKGYRYVLVNGEVTIEDDKPTNRHSGELLRNGKARKKSSRAAAA